MMIQHSYIVTYVSRYSSKTTMSAPSPHLVLRMMRMILMMMTS